LNGSELPGGEKASRLFHALLAAEGKHWEPQMNADAYRCTVRLRERTDEADHAAHPRLPAVSLIRFSELMDDGRHGA
jgi:hypothetical protein